ncbi:hypothetical protein [Roseateles noduli]|uniref:hypothetical protein n=1 Tax=Roseateles noduli TaxID=2052484 RepID=UPI003D65DB7F
MKEQISPSEEDRQLGNLVKAALALVLMVLIMFWWWNYPLPSGKRPDLFDFVQFFGRELLFVIPLILVAVILAVVAAWRICARGLKRWGRARSD